jgi:biopolymer transport protein ExbD
LKIAPASKGDEFELNVISLIDVMLTLLMFFVMTASFEQRALMKVTLPESQAAATTQAQRDPLIVLVDRDGRYFVGKSEVLNPSLATLKAAISQEAGSDRQRPVTLRADGRTPHQAVVTAMDALGQLGFVHLTIATVPAKSGS